MKIIGLTGQAGCGKDTIGEYLKNNHGFHVTSYAYPIKAALIAMFNIGVDPFYDRDKKEQRLSYIHKSPRELMQTLGTEWGREMVHQDLWGILLQQRIEWANTECGCEKFVITDVRFENEAARIRKMGGTIWYILRPDNPHQLNTGHKSEQPIERLQPEIVIANNGSIEELHNIVDTIIAREAA